MKFKNNVRIFLPCLKQKFLPFKIEIAKNYTPEKSKSKTFFAMFFKSFCKQKKALFSLIFSTAKSHIFDPAKKAN
jgi:hypothetical protein